MKAKTLGEQIRDMNRKDPSNTEKIPILCDKCGYYWRYSGKMSRATCPDCGGKVRVEKQRQDRIL